MKTLTYTLWLYLALLTGFWLLSDATPLASLDGFFAWRGVLMQYSGVLGIGVMSLAMLLAIRPRLLEAPLGGLDKLYRLHKWLGISGLVISITHWLLAKGPKWLVGLGWLERPARKPREQIGVAIVRGRQECISGDASRCAWLVVDYHCLPHVLAQRFGHRTGNDVRSATGRRRHQDLEGTGGPVVLSLAEWAEC